MDQVPQRNLNDYHIPKGRRIDLIGRFLRPFFLIGAALLFLVSNDKDQFIGHIAVYNETRRINQGVPRGVVQEHNSRNWRKLYVGACLYSPSSNHDFGKADRIRKVR